MAKDGLVALLGSGRTLGDAHRAKAHEVNLGASEHHVAAEGVAFLAVGGQADIEGHFTRAAEGSGGVDQEDLLLGDVGHEYRRVFIGSFGTVGRVAIPRDGQVFACGGDADFRQLSRRGVAEGVDVAQVDALGVAIDGGDSGELLDKGVVAGHAAGSRREQEGQLFSGELANDVEDFPEEAALRGLASGLRVLYGLGEATHVGDAVPRGTNDGSDFTFESSEDSLFDFTHDL